jgi:hypothetical protein
MVSEKYVSIQEARYLLAKHIPMVMGSLMLDKFEMRPWGFIGQAEAVVSYYSILTHKFYGFGRLVEYELIKNRPDMIKNYLDQMFYHILRDVCDEETKDQEDLILQRVKTAMEERDRLGRCN